VARQDDRLEALSDGSVADAIGGSSQRRVLRLGLIIARKVPKPVTARVDLNEATREVIALVWSELQRDRVVLRSELADDLPAVLGDRIQLQQVILNLVSNAAAAMSQVDDRPRQLSITTKRDAPQCVRLTVQDAGVGLDAKTLEQRFESFYPTKGSGMAIGSSVSRAIVERHRGRLWATPNDGPGATFSFSIPRAPRSP
jgi:C4-dicarboxylate-specific signal transduction histidine kinase